MKTSLSTLALVAALGLAGAASAQPSGGPDAKGNAPLKHAHTVNDGAPKHGANSFTEGQARRHIEKAGFTGVEHLVKGGDGVWRGRAMRDGGPVDVAMDFKGNVTTEGPAPVPPGPDAAGGVAPMADAGAPPMAGEAPPAAAAHHHRRHHRHHHASCAHPSPNGAACSGVDKNGNGISDREDRATGR
jgi:hypothetical protein